MKQFTEPVIEELNIIQTAYWAISGDNQDGSYQAQDGKYSVPSYSGEGSQEEFFDHVFGEE